jgi:hypothetical protein
MEKSQSALKARFKELGAKSDKPDQRTSTGGEKGGMKISDQAFT